MFKNIALAATTAAALLAVSPASAQSITYNATATVGSICGAYRAAGTTVAVDFGDLSATDASTTLPTVGTGSVTYRCNAPAGFKRTITSVNGGKLVRDGSNGDASNSVAYTVQHGGGSGLGFAATAIAAPREDNFNASPAFLSGQTGSGLGFNISGVRTINTNANNAPGTTVFAGTYTDTVTLTVTAN